MRRYVVRIVGLAVLASLLTAMLTVSGALAASSQPVTTPVFDAGNFDSRSTRITNPYFPLRPGTTFVYQGIQGDRGERIEVYVTNRTKVILGVTCVVVRDRVWADGVLAEDTFDWYAQDKAGNVWYMGEDTTEYVDGVPVSHAGSWEAGVDGARPGYIMEAHAAVGDAYRQEYLAGEAEDMAQVLGVTASVEVPYGSWEGNVLLTKDWTPLDPKVVEQKYYAYGVGNVKTRTAKGGSGGAELVEIRRR